MASTEYSAESPHPAITRQGFGAPAGMDDKPGSRSIPQASGVPGSSQALRPGIRLLAGAASLPGLVYAVAQCLLFFQGASGLRLEFVSFLFIAIALGFLLVAIAGYIPISAARSSVGITPGVSNADATGPSEPKTDKPMHETVH